MTTTHGDRTYAKSYTGEIKGSYHRTEGGNAEEKATAQIHLVENKRMLVSKTHLDTKKDPLRLLQVLGLNVETFKDKRILFPVLLKMSKD